MKKTFFYNFIFLLLIALSSCNTKKTIEGKNVNNKDVEGKDSIQNSFYSIPSPMEIVQLIKKAGAKYNNTYLNSPKNMSKYNTETTRSLNLGIYCSDLCFASIFGQTQDAILSLNAARYLSNLIGIKGAFENETVKRFEANVNNTDSIINIISEGLMTIDSHLKENELSCNASLALAGGWIEGLYIATSIANTTYNPKIINRVVEQKLSLQNLINILEKNCHTKDSEFIMKLFKVDVIK